MEYIDWIRDKNAKEFMHTLQKQAINIVVSKKHLEEDQGEIVRQACDLMKAGETKIGWRPNKCQQ